MAASRSLPLALASALEGFSGWHTLLRCQVFHYHIIRQPSFGRVFRSVRGLFHHALTLAELAWIRHRLVAPHARVQPGEVANLPGFTSSQAASTSGQRWEAKD